MEPLSDTDRDFARDMANIYACAKKETGYNATLFLRMLSQHGALETARRLVGAGKPSDGFTSLWERGRLDLTVEALVLEKRYEGLFTAELLEQARARLLDYGYSI
jgi:hypothetical protein